MTVQEAAAANEVLQELTTPRPLSEYHEDMGPVLWWCWEIPECGRCDGSGTVYDNVRAETFACPICNGKKPDEGRWLGEEPWVGTTNDIGKEVLIETRSYTIVAGLVEQLTPYHGSRTQRVNVGGWPGYHTHWSPLPKVREP